MTHAADAEVSHSATFGTLTIRRHAGRDTGARAISLRTLDFTKGISPSWSNPGCDDLLYVVSGRATLYLDGVHASLTPGSGVYIAPGRAATVRNDGPDPLHLVSSQCPEPPQPDRIATPVIDPNPANPPPDPPPISRLSEVAAEVTGDRWYRVLVDGKFGSHHVTQFVGSIPPGRAPDHYHHYEEVLYILEGSGRMWAGAESAPIRPGSCIFLPATQLHCVENSGPGDLRLLGVFYPAGSPAVRYDPT